MIDLKTIDCVGCTACYNICPIGAIEMVEDCEGFKFPQIDTQKCVNCGMCEKVCIPSNGCKKQPFETKAFGVKNKNLDERKKSQSGGVFYVLAKYVIAQGGIVYGSLIDDDFVVKHARACTYEEIKKFRGSKYVQSDLGDTYLRIQKDLESGVLVLFSGTPCQVAGLKSFLQMDYENLILVDLICHGVPSPMVWKDYIEWQQGNLSKPIMQVEFRDLSFTWGKCREAIYTTKKITSDIYAKIFYSRNAHRKSCYNCLFANTEKITDITIGDYWGIDNIKPEFRDEFGVSAVLINSEHGRRVWGGVSGEFDFFECKTENIVAGNPQLSKPVAKPETRDIFWKDYLQNEFSFIAKKYGGNNFKGKVKRLIKHVLGRL